MPQSSDRICRCAGVGATNLGLRDLGGIHQISGVRVPATFTASDGQQSIGTTSYTVTEMADRVERALRTIPVRLGPNALAILREGSTVPLSGGEYAAMALAVATMLAGEG